MLASTGQGQGNVIITNSDAGQALAPPLIASVANEWTGAYPIGDTRWACAPDDFSPGHDRVANMRVKIDVNTAILARHVGSLALAPDLLLDTTLADGQLRSRPGEQLQFPLFAEWLSRFLLEAVDAQVTFVVDRSGRPTATVGW